LVLVLGSIGLEEHLVSVLDAVFDLLHDHGRDGATVGRDVAGSGQRDRRASDQREERAEGTLMRQARIVRGVVLRARQIERDGQTQGVGDVGQDVAVDDALLHQHLTGRAPVRRLGHEDDRVDVGLEGVEVDQTRGQRLPLEGVSVVPPSAL